MKRLLLIIACVISLVGCSKDTPKQYEIKVEEGTTQKSGDQLMITYFELDAAGDCVHTDYFFLKDGMSRTFESDDRAVKVRIKVKGDIRTQGKVNAYCTEVMSLEKKKTASMTIKWNTAFND